MPGEKRKENSLLCFVQALVGVRVVVELRYDTIIRGMVESVDDNMNLTMTGVSMQQLQGSAQTLEFLYIKGRHIRFIHLPGSLDAARLVESHKARTREEARMNARDAAVSYQAAPAGSTGKPAGCL